MRSSRGASTGSDRRDARALAPSRETLEEVCVMWRNSTFCGLACAALLAPGGAAAQPLGTLT